MKKTLITLIVLATASICAANDGWTQLSSMQTARDQFAGCVNGNEIFVFGGNDPTGFNLYTGEKYNIATDTWSSIADNPHYEHPWSHPEGVEELTGVALDGKFYVFGAYGGFEDPVNGYYGVFNYNQMYDPATDTWTTLAKKPTTTAASVAVTYDHKIYLFGGYFNNDGPSDEIDYKLVEVYDPATDQWDFAGEMPKLIFGMAIAVHDNSAYFIGGIDLDTFEFNDDVMAYNFETGEWIHNYCTASPEAVRFYPYATQMPVVNGKAYLAGGVVGDLQTFDFEASDKLTLFDIDNKSWQSGPALPQTRESHLTLVSNNVIYVVGGCEEEDEPAQATVFAYRLIDSGSPDLNGDDSVNMYDFQILAARWLMNGCVASDWCDGADIDRSGDVGIEDLLLLADNWLKQGSISDHVFEIEMSLSYDFGEGYTSSEPEEYEFDAWMRVDDTVVGGTVETPGGAVYQAEWDYDDDEIWLGIGVGSYSLDDLADFTDGEYTFTVFYANGTSQSTSILFALEDGSPIPPVDRVPMVTYQGQPLHNATRIPLSIDIDLALENPQPDWTYGIEWFPRNEASGGVSGEIEGLPCTVTTAGPLNLSRNTQYEMEVTVNHAIWSTNEDGIPYVVDKDAEIEILFTTTFR